MNAVEFVARTSELSFPNVFNPYRDNCEEYDHPASSLIRRSNLQRYLSTMVDRGVDSLWLGRDCGYRGARRTGIALTDEAQLDNLQRQFGFKGLRKATIGTAVRERTATQVWKIIREVNANVFLWNVFPFHPFEPAFPMSNRRHTAREFEASKELLTAIVQLLQPNRIMALGADAYRALQKLGLKATLVRHPSYGGHLEFAATIRRNYTKS